MPAQSSPTLGPISLDWTVPEFLETLTADDGLDAVSLDVLLNIESGLIERSASASPALPWLQAPGAVAVVRSIVDLLRTDPSTRSLTLGELLSPSTAPPTGRVLLTVAV